MTTEITLPKITLTEDDFVLYLNREPKSVAEFKNFCDAYESQMIYNIDFASEIFCITEEDVEEE